MQSTAFVAFIPQSWLRVQSCVSHNGSILERKQHQHPEVATPSDSQYWGPCPKWKHPVRHLFLLHAALKGFRAKLMFLPLQAWLQVIHCWQPSCYQWTSDATEYTPASPHLTSRGCEQPECSSNWIWTQPCEHFNPRIESRFCAFAAPRNVHCLFFVVTKRSARVTLFNRCCIFNNSGTPFTVLHP